MSEIPIKDLVKMEKFMREFAGHLAKAERMGHKSDFEGSRYIQISDKSADWIISQLRIYADIIGDSL